MADPQTHTDGEKNAGRNAGAATQTGSSKPAQAEARTFGETRRAEAGPGEEPVSSEGGGLVHSGRRAGRDVADAWARSFDPFLAMHMDMNRWFDELWRQTTGLAAHAPMRTGRPLGAFGPAAFLGQPPADLRETDKAYELAVELPGLTRGDIEVTVGRDALTIRGHKAEQSGEGAGAYRVSERRFGRFERAFPLPDDIDAKKIDARFKDGLLEITLPKIDDAAVSRSRIEIR